MTNTGRFIILGLAIAVSSCAGKKAESSPSLPPQHEGLVTAMAKMGNLATDPFAQMSFEFEGNPSKQEIQEKLDKVFMLYSLEPNKDNRSSAGRVLVALRKEHGHSEMAILDKMLGSDAGGTFEDAAAKFSAGM